MKKFLIWLVVIIVLLVAGFFAFNSYIYNEKQGNQKPALSPKDATYVIDGEAVTLKNGLSEVEAAPGSALKIITRYFGNEVTHDFDKDGREDMVFLLTKDSGGSGTFFYVVAALNKENGYVGSQAFFIGDRIAPQTTEMGKGDVVVNYADRKDGESFTTRPSLGKSLWLSLDTENLKFTNVGQTGGL